MELEDNFCTLEQAKKLQELGIKAKSCFVYKINDVQTVIVEKKHFDDIQKHMPYIGNVAAPAYTVTELLALTPWRLGSDYRFQLRGFDSEKGQRTYQVLFMDLDGSLLYDMFNDMLPWLLADNIIFMLEKRFIEVEEINARSK